MLNKIILVLIINLSIQGFAFAQEKVRVEDRMIGSAFKALAKAFVMAVDIDRLKKDNADKLKKMNEAKFNKKYAAAFKVIKDLPPKLKADYGITESMTKERAIQNIESLDKKKVYEMIDSIPDEIIAGQFKQYLREKKEEIEKSGIVEQINKFWNKIIGKTVTPPAEKSDRRRIE